MSLYQYLQYQSKTVSSLSEFVVSVFGPSFSSREKPAPAIITTFTLLLSFLTVTNYWDCQALLTALLQHINFMLLLLLSHFSHVRPCATP